ncbi:MAG: lipid II flippase MurJ, partial [Methylotenera sp. 17-45-7]
GFYARQNIKTPVKIAVFTLVMTQLMNILFVFVLDLRHAGLALAIGVGACINAALLYYHLRKSGCFHLQAGWFKFLIKLVFALIVMGTVLYYTMGDATTWLNYSLLERLIYLTGLVLLGAVSYFATLLLVGFRPRDYIRRVNR